VALRRVYIYIILYTYIYNIIYIYIYSASSHTRQQRVKRGVPAIAGGGTRARNLLAPHGGVRARGGHAPRQPLHRNVQRFRGGLVCKAHVYHCLRVIKKKKKHLGAVAIRIQPLARDAFHHPSPSPRGGLPWRRAPLGGGEESQNLQHKHLSMGGCDQEAGTPHLPPPREGRALAGCTSLFI